VEALTHCGVSTVLHSASIASGLATARHCFCSAASRSSMMRSTWRSKILRVYPPIPGGGLTIGVTLRVYFTWLPSVVLMPAGVTCTKRQKKCINSRILQSTETCVLRGLSSLSLYP